MEDPTFDLYYKMAQKILKVVGLDIPHRGWKIFNPLLFFSWMIILGQVFLSPLFIYNNINSLSLVTECASTLGTGIQIFLKIQIMVYNRNGWADIIELIRDQRREFIKNYENILANQTNRAIFWVKSLYYLYLVVSVGFILTPVFHPDPNKLPLTVILPYMPWNENPYWAINYINHIFSVLVATHYTNGVDALTLLIISHSYCRLDVLIEMVNELQGLVDRKVGGSPNLEAEINAKIKSLYTEHYTTIDFVKKSHKYLQIILLVQMFTVSMIICMSLNVIASTWANGCYIFLVAGAFQHFVSCYFGNILIVKNDNFIERIYSLEWYKLTVPQQKSIKLILQSSQRPLEINALFFPVNMESFLVLIKSSYSFFTILQKTE